MVPTLSHTYRNKKSLASYGKGFLFLSQKDFTLSYRVIAPEGHASAQVPHSVHSSGLIEYFSPSEIAPTGHSSIHVPQATQSSLIT